MVDTTAFAAGGEAIGRLPDGRVVFVAGALPDETVEVVVTDNARDFARGRVERVLEPSPDRVAPTCARVAAGCGGCQWQHVDPAVQPAWKAAIVRDTLRRVGRLRDHDRTVVAGPDLPADGYRTSVRAAVTGDGRAGYRMAHSNDVCVVVPGEVAHPLITRVLAQRRLPGAR